MKNLLVVAYIFVLIFHPGAGCAPQGDLSRPALSDSARSETDAKSHPVNRIHLYNGDRISGTIVSMDASALIVANYLSPRLKIDSGAVMAIDWFPQEKKMLAVRDKEMDQIVFTNGDRMTGEIIFLDPNQVKINFFGRVISINNQQINHILFGQKEKFDFSFPAKEQRIVMLNLRNGDRITGRLLSFQSGMFLLQTRYSPNIEVSISALNSINFFGQEQMLSMRAEGLVAYYPLDGNANNAAGNKFNGRVSGAVPTEDRFGRPDSAYLFRTNSDYISCGDIPVTDSMTLEAWIYPTSLDFDAAAGTFLEKGSCTLASRSGYILMMGGSSLPASIVFGISNDSGTQGTFVTNGAIESLNRWYHVVVVVDAEHKNVRMYVNGELRHTEAWDYPRNRVPGSSVFIGRESEESYSKRRFIGKIDDVRIYDRALSDEEVLAYHYMDIQN